MTKARSLPGQGGEEDEEEENKDDVVGPLPLGARLDEEPDEKSEVTSDAGSTGWPPKPPLLRFKMRIQFGSRFRPSEHKKLFATVNQETDFAALEHRSSALQDRVVGWVNHSFALKLTTEFQFEVSFPTIVLFILDAIYTRKINWREVDFRYQYKQALQNNYEVLDKIWHQVNMDKAREFRVENTDLRLENMPCSPLKDKLDFIKVLQRWYQMRCHNVDPYEPLSRRRVIAKQCLASGHMVQFPPWIIHEKKDPKMLPPAPVREDLWRIASKSPLQVKSSREPDSEVLGQKKYGEVFGAEKEGSWLKLSDEPGWIQAESDDPNETLVLKEVPETTSPAEGACQTREIGAGSARSKGGKLSDEEYNKLPEFKRLGWYLGTNDYSSM